MLNGQRAQAQNFRKDGLFVGFLNMFLFRFGHPVH
mgnify:FL=1